MWEQEAKREIDKSLLIATQAMGYIGVSLDKPTSNIFKYVQNIKFIAAISSISYLVFSEFVYICVTLSNTPKIEDLVPLFHIIGYGVLSVAKIIALWYKKDTFGQLLRELCEIWPVEPLENKAREIKFRSLNSLHICNRWYLAMSICGVCFYSLTPIAVYLYQLLRGYDNPQIGFVWFSWYPFDKHHPVTHIFVYLFEVYAGVISVSIMISTDLLFFTMANHITLLLRLLKQKLETFGAADQTQEEYYKEIVAYIKLHQRLIRYYEHLEQAFTKVNFVNIFLSSGIICCVMFVIVVSTDLFKPVWLADVCIVLSCVEMQFCLSMYKKWLSLVPVRTMLKKVKLLDPLMEATSKLFLGAALIQVNLMCWYADEIISANADIAIAAYNNQWIRTNSRCRRCVVILIQRAQKPIAFTAMNFTNISLVTFTSILTRSYSYFTLLYTMYTD